MLALHFVQLAAAAFFPFTAALYGHYPTNPAGVIFYVGSVAAYSWAAFGNLVVAKRAGALSDELRATVNTMEELARWWFDVGDPQPGGH